MILTERFSGIPQGIRKVAEILRVVNIFELADKQGEMLLNAEEDYGIADKKISTNIKN